MRRKSVAVLAPLFCVLMTLPATPASAAQAGGGCVEFTGLPSGYRAARWDFITTDYRTTADAEVFTKAWNAGNPCTSYGGVAVEAAIVQQRYSAGSWGVCDVVWSNIDTSGWTGYERTSCDQGSGTASPNKMTGSHRAWVTGTAYDSPSVTYSIGNG